MIFKNILFYVKIQLLKSKIIRYTNLIYDALCKKKTTAFSNSMILFDVNIWFPVINSFKALTKEDSALDLR